MFRAIPLFVIMLIVYNINMFIGDINGNLNAEIASFGLVSGAQWRFSVSDLYIVLGILMLNIEVFKSTATGATSIIDHSLSMIVFIIFLIEFLVVKDCGTSTFFILGLMSLLDVIAGFTVSIVAARRDFNFGPHHD